MDNFGYIGISLLLLPLWIFIYTKAKRLRVRMRNSGVYVGLVAVVTEPIFMIDYWTPPSLFGIDGFYIVEDFIYGFLISGISISIYNFVFNISYKTKYKKYKKASVILTVGMLLSFLIFNLIFKYNSVLSISYSVIVATLIMITYRKDLLLPAFLSGVMLVVISTIIYTLIFNFILTSYWYDYWKLANSSYGYFILGIPWTEYLWYFTLGFYISIVYDFASGTAKEINLRS